MSVVSRAFSSQSPEKAQLRATPAGTELVTERVARREGVYRFDFAQGEAPARACASLYRAAELTLAGLRSRSFGLMLPAP